MSMYILIQETQHLLNVLYPVEESALQVSFNDEYACISFTDEETGVEATVQLHKGTVLEIAKRITDEISRQAKSTIAARNQTPKNLSQANETSF